MNDVRAVIPLTFHHEALRPDHLLRWAELHRQAEDHAVRGLVEPLLIDRRAAVARAPDDIDGVIADHGLPEPVGKPHLGGKAGKRERGERRLAVLGQHECVQVLRLAREARVALERVAAPNEERNTGLPEGDQRGDVRVGGEDRRRHGKTQGCSFHAVEFAEARGTRLRGRYNRG